MSDKTDFLLKWLGDGFFEKGAFTTSKDPQKLILGKGGFFSEEKDSENPHFFYIKEFFRPKYYYYYPEVLLEVQKQDVNLALGQYRDLEIHYQTNENYDDVFKNDFQHLKSMLDDHFMKAVLVSSEKIRVKNPKELKRKIISKAIAAEMGTPYGIWMNDFGIIGSTPEILFECHENKIHTVAIAGTGKKGEEKKLIESAKDKKEHNLVIQNIVQCLEQYCSHVKTKETMVVPFSKMIHLKTDIQGEMKSDITWDNLIDHLSPTAALGGYPKTEAKNFLEKTRYTKMFPHRFFGSVFGFSHQDMNRALVMIRNIQLLGKDIMIESGVGIIKESEFENELNEIKLKRETVKEMFL
jgi:menaquinone-specific isochorismate synthase